MSEPPPRLSTSKVGLCCSCPLRGPRGRGVVWYWARVAVTVYDSVRVCVRSAPCAWRCAIVAGLARAPPCSLARILPCVISSSVSSCLLSLFVLFVSQMSSKSMLSSVRGRFSPCRSRTRRRTKPASRHSYAPFTMRSMACGPSSIPARLCPRLSPCRIM